MFPIFTIACCVIGEDGSTFSCSMTCTTVLILILVTHLLPFSQYTSNFIKFKYVASTTLIFFLSVLINASSVVFSVGLAGVVIILFVLETSYRKLIEVVRFSPAFGSRKSAHSSWLMRMEV